MKFRVLFVFAFATVLVIGASASATRAQIVGGYGDIESTSKEARRAAAVAIRAHGAQTGKRVTLVSIRKAEAQVVAGMNYRICMRVRDARRRVTTVTAVVYQNLQNRRTLSQWKTGGCSDL